MKVQHPWQCDICGRTKGPSNHWWIGYPHSHPPKGLVIQRWDDALAAAEGAGHVHLCGLQCATRWVTRFLPECDDKPQGVT